MKNKNSVDKNILVSNRKASRNYQILEKFEAGIVLTGTEVKSVKLGHASIQEGYVHIDKKMEIWLIGSTIQPYSYGNILNHKIDQERKLLLHHKEIQRLYGKVKENGLTIIPIRFYLLKGKVKILIGLGRGKDLMDKRESIKKRESDRDTRRIIKSYNNK
mgnify:CR=1 FL=1